MLRLQTNIALIAAVASAAGCGIDRPLAAVIAPHSAASSTESTASVGADEANDFALRLFAQTRNAEASSNVLIAPFSAATTLGMLWAGAGGSTADELASTLGYAREATTGPMALGALDASLGEAGGKNVALSTANRIWAARDIVIRDTFTQRLTTGFRADLGRVDFAAAPEAARTDINAWVASMTAGTIQDLLPPSAVTNQTRVVLTNAFHMKAPWAHPFDSEATVDGTFHAALGDKPVRMMRQTERLRYGESSGMRALELAYEGNRLAFDVILPEGDASQVAQAAQAAAAPLTRESLMSLFAALTFRDVAVQLPAFRTEQALSLAASLKQLGIRHAFDTDADFTAMTAESDLHVADVLQKTFLDVTEAGTEAGASTAVVVERYSDGGPKIPFIADRPFVYVLRDKLTGVLLLIGEYRGPAA